MADLASLLRCEAATSLFLVVSIELLACSGSTKHCQPFCAKVESPAD
jgi:hypothetical protein